MGQLKCAQLNAVFSAGFILLLMSNIREKLFVLVGFLILHLRPAIPGQLFGSFYLVGTIAFMTILFYMDRKVLLKKVFIYF